LWVELARTYSGHRRPRRARSSLGKNAPNHVVVDAELSRDRPDRPAVDEVVSHDLVFDFGVDLLHRSPPWWRSRSPAFGREREALGSQEWAAPAATEAARALSVSGVSGAPLGHRA
ncbi:MAG TPA: hypothetical protein DEA59_09585, partial [Microbacterium sp.]|nr:hypothetical protein [Microbacterium sp.]